MSSEKKNEGVCFLFNREKPPPELIEAQPTTDINHLAFPAQSKFIMFLFIICVNAAAMHKTINDSKQRAMCKGLQVVFSYILTDSRYYTGLSIMITHLCGTFCFTALCPYLICIQTYQIRRQVVSISQLDAQAISERQCSLLFHVVVSS